MKRKLTVKQIIISVCVGLICSTSTGMVQSAISPDPLLQPAQIQPLNPAPRPDDDLATDMSRVNANLGPFQTVQVSGDSPTPDTRSPAFLVLNDDGGTMASATYTVPFKTLPWKRSDAFQITGVTVERGYATIGTSFGRSYIVAVDQPFLFERQPETTVLIDGSGSQWQITTTRAMTSAQQLGD